MAMSDSIESNDERRPCLHCLIGDVIDDFYAEYGSLSGEKDAIDVDEIVTALAKTVAELTYGSDAALRQRILDDLVREISEFEAEFANARASNMRHGPVTGRHGSTCQEADAPGVKVPAPSAAADGATLCGVCANSTRPPSSSAWPGGMRPFCWP